jgi:hypothetical protein
MHVGLIARNWGKAINGLIPANHSAFLLVLVDYFDYFRLDGKAARAVPAHLIVNNA